ncbi:MAG TPA: tRNA-binding protein [Candidatus Nitrosotalea sp.]|nr:tRNA-binding protein [Nitrososphaerota archaeon]HKU33015.1 tRNA-binding protein [Candidatus Nitrosotalea sp.]
MDPITYDDFAKLEIRVAKIVEVEKIPGKSKIIKGIIDLGEEKRQVIIGGAEYYQPEELVNKKVIVLANLESRKIAGVESNAMLLAADLNDKPFWLTVNEDVPLGTKIK